MRAASGTERARRYGRPGPMITGDVGLDEVGAAFTALGDPEAHVKILVHPGQRR